MSWHDAKSEVRQVAVSYKKLWKILIDKDMKKQDLQRLAGVSWGAITKLSKGETVSMDVIIKICKCLKCDIGDIMELVPDNPNDEMS
jgi:DNA-binding Xre family transcriptional regulator